MNLQRLSRALEKPVAIEPLVTFRILFGAIMAFSTIRFMTLGWIDDHYLKPLFHFKYYGFEWVGVLPPVAMYAIHILMVVASIGVMMGWYYRLSAIVLFITFTYTELIDLTYYLNHYYFVSIVSALMIILPAHRAFSVDTLRAPGKTLNSVPAWVILILKFQLAIVYIYAGLAKINYDWLVLALPMKIWLPANDKLPLVGWLFTLPWIPYAFSWLGMLYDCTIVAWLSFRKTRLAAYASVIFFHGITGMIFQIGVFPLVMIAATLIFFSEQWHKNLISTLRSMTKKIAGKRSAPRDEAPPLPGEAFGIHSQPVLRYFLMTYVVFQLLFPWRYLLYPGNLFWTEQGYRFSWRVMLMEKAGTATFYVRDGHTSREGIVVNSEFLNAHQEKQMSMQPDMILQFARFLKEWYKAHGVHDPQVRAEVYVTLNARPSKLLIDPTLDLALLEDNWKTKDWILPYSENENQ